MARRKATATTAEAPSSETEAPTIEHALAVEQWPIGKLKAYKRNAKMHPPEQIALLARILQRHGFDQPIVVDKRGTIVKGHGRWMAANELGMATVPVIVRDLTAAQAAEARIADNRVAEFGWDFDALVADVVANLKDGLDPEVIGWSLADLGLEMRDDGSFEQIGGGSPDAKVYTVVEDEAPAPPKKATTKLGQIWQLGKHRVFCADALHMAPGALRTTPLVLTDPPYNIAGNKPKLLAVHASKAMAELQKTEWDMNFDPTLLRGAVDRVADPKGVSVYVFTSQFLIQQIWNLFEGYQHVGYCVWTKPNPMPALSKRHWTWATELCVYATNGKHVFNFPAEGHALNTWAIPKAPSKEHPTAKAVKLFAHIVQHSSNEGDVVVDFFGGSGTAVVAAEQLGRQADVVELSPNYCDVIVERWQNLTGGKAKLVSS